MKILHWNCQGLGNPLTISHLKDIRRTSNPDIVFLIETKNGYEVVSRLCESLQYPYSFILPACGSSGGLAVFWNHRVQLDFKRPPTLNRTDVYVSNGTGCFLLSYIYGHPNSKYRNEMWNNMIFDSETAQSNPCPWLVLGDMNDIKSPEEKQGGPYRSASTFQVFKRMMSVCGLHDLKMNGGQFTWAGHRHAYFIKSKIDRALANCAWLDLFPDAYIQLFPWIGSDHRPLLIHTELGQIIKSGVLGYVKLFFEYGYLDPAMNHTHICLIPKSDSPSTARDYRPISLTNVAYKIISKILAERLKPWLPLIISENQSAFVSGRLITDNILIAHELLHSMNACKRTHASLAVKLDISKAFDKVEWSFLNVVMTKMGFSQVWRNWIMKCITSVTYSILVNGSPTRTIVPQRGIRQGDPISPFLYLICTEGLSSLIAARVREAKLTGFKASRWGPAVSHLFFADDSLLFLQASIKECQELLNVLQIYQQASGQEINYKKSAIIFSKGVSSQLRSSICTLMGIHKNGGFERECSINWPAGTQSFFHQLITSAIRRFWWSRDGQHRRMAWIAWSKLTTSKRQGGLGFRDLQSFNIALLAKQGWRILTYPNSLLARILQAKYYRQSTFLQAHSTRRSSYAWRSIIQSQPLIQTGIRWRVGNGCRINVWTDNWLPTIPSRSARGPGTLTHPSLSVQDLMDPSTGEWNRVKLHHLLDPEDVELVLKLRPLHVNGEDQPLWIFSTAGDYIVKSGYYTHLNMARYVNPLELIGQDTRLYQHIWKLDVPPKLQHFWWRVIHNSLPTATKLVARGCIKDSQCLLCGEAEETLNHLLFQCRIAKEIWELAPIKTPPSDQLTSNTLIQNVKAFLALASLEHEKHLPIPQQKLPIPYVIRQASLDYRLWEDSKQWRNTGGGTPLSSMRQEFQSLQDFIVAQGSFCCTVDASWTSSESKSGIAWILYQENGRCLLQGRASIEPLTTSREAEAIALLYAVKELRRLKFKQVLFVGDSKPIYEELSSFLSSVPQLSRQRSITSPTTKEIAHLASPDYAFSFQVVKRELIKEVDRLAKYARKKCSSYHVTWKTM